MKKFVTLLLVLAMVLGLCACGGSGAAEQTDAPAAEGLQVGYAKVNITPGYSVSLRGYSDDETRKSEGFIEYIYATCLAITYGEETILAYTVDNLSIDHGYAEKFRKEIVPATGIPGEKIYFGATHCHNCPLVTGQYEDDLNAWMVEAAQKALADRAPATMLAGTQEIPLMNFDRHYKTDKGTYFGPSFGTKDGEVVGHATETDPQMVLVKFDYTDESKKDVLMVNWQAHPDFASAIGYYQIAPSFIGPLRDELEKLSGMHVAYFNGASGNLVADSQMESEKHGLDWREYGIKMGQLANDALTCLKPATGTGIKTQHQMLTVNINHDWDHMIEQANEVFDTWKNIGKAAGDALGKTYGFTSSYQARAIRSRYDMKETTQLETNAFSVCGVGFTTGTYEMFAGSSNYVKQNSPFDVTFVITGNQYYIPVPEAYDYRSYEADTSLFAKGTAEQLAENYVEMLGKVK